MSFREWYIRKIMNQDPKLVHSSIWNRARKEINSLSPRKKAHLKEMWRLFKERDPKTDIPSEYDSIETDIPSRDSILPEGMSVPVGINSMSDLDYYMNLSEKDRADYLHESKKDSTPVQLPLFKKLENLRAALKKIGISI